VVESSAVCSGRLPTISAMHPTLVREPLHRPGWVYERKEDGWRMLAYKDVQTVRLISRRGVDHTARFPDTAGA
jgi:ATP-dependent DNA ligase